MSTKEKLTTDNKRSEPIDGLIERLATKQVKKQKEVSEKRILERIKFDNKLSKFE